MAKAFKILPKNYFSDWGEFESWAQGANSSPDGWIAASSPYLKQETSVIKFGLSSALVGGSNGVGGIYRTVPGGSELSGQTFKFGVWGRSASTGPYIEINDGITSKTVHLDGLNAYSFFTTPAMKLDYAATQLRINLFSSLAATAYFDGAVLCEGEDLFTNFDTNIDVAEWQPTLNLKMDQYEIANKEGSFIPDHHLQGRNISISGQVIGSDVASTRSHFDLLMKSLIDWNMSQKRHLYLYDDRVTDVFLKGNSWEYVNGLQMIRYNLDMTAADPTTRSIGKYRKRQVISGTVTEFNLTYNGNAQAKPIVSFIADQGSAITTCQLQNLTTQENMIYFGTVPTNVALDIDCDAGTVFNSSINRVSDFGTSDFLKVVRGTNYFRYSGTPCTINIDYFEKFL